MTPEAFEIVCRLLTTLAARIGAESHRPWHTAKWHERQNLRVAAVKRAGLSKEHVRLIQQHASATEEAKAMVNAIDAEVAEASKGQVKL